MGFKTGISWTDHTFNTHWGCTPTPGDPACTNCYALRDSRRFGLDIFGANRPRRFFGAEHWREPLKWDRLAAREGRMHRVFCNSMGDVFEDYRAPAGSETAGLEYWRQRLWDLIRATPHLFYLILTKHPENIPHMLPDSLAPTQNLALGVTAANQEWAERRLPLLFQVPAALYFVSIEPQLGMLDLSRLALSGGKTMNALSGAVSSPEGGVETSGPRLGWVISGGESGPRARPTHPEWPRSLLRQCRSHQVPFFYKQVGEWAPVSNYPPQAGDLQVFVDGTTAQDERRWEAIAVGHLVTMRRVGRKAAGDLLDGEQHHEVPDLEEFCR
jgi:protein gp37